MTAMTLEQLWHSPRTEFVGHNYSKRKRGPDSDSGRRFQMKVPDCSPISPVPSGGKLRTPGGHQSAGFHKLGVVPVSSLFSKRPALEQ